MKITVIHGQDHQGSTYKLTWELLEKVRPSHLDEFFLPKDFSSFCTGCGKCFTEGEDRCPHYGSLKPIVDSMLSSDVIILDSPTYCFSPSGQMKAFLDHLGYLWMAHRPDPSMFGKIGVVISTCAGKGADKTTEFLDEQLFFLGVPTRYQIAITVPSDKWENVPPKVRAKADERLKSVAKSIKSEKCTVGPKMKTVFKIMKINQDRNEWNPLDKNHWKDNGWLDGKKPW